MDRTCVPFCGARDRAVPGRSFPHRRKAPPARRRHGIPLAVALTGGNRNDVTQLIPLLEDLHARPVAGKTGRPRRNPDLVIADRGYDHDKYRRMLRQRAIKPVVARRGTEHRSGLGRQRRVVERGVAHPHNFRRLRIRHERYPEIHTALLVLAYSILCWRRLKSL